MACIRERRGKLVLDYRDTLRRRRWKEFENTKDGRALAEIALGDVLRAKRAGLSLDGKVTVGQFIDSWLKVAQQTVRPQTLEHYRVWSDRLRARFGSEPLSTLSAPRLLDFGAELLEEGLARATVAVILGTAHTFLEHAVRCGNLVRNPASGLGRVLKLRRKETADIKAMTEDQLARFLAAAAALAGNAGVALHVYAYTGLRLSEGLGLALGHFDASTGRLRVEQQRLEDGVLHRLKTPAARRWVDVAAPLRALLASHVGERREAALRAGQGQPRLLLGDGLAHHQVQRAFAAARAAARLPEHFTVHCLRHSFATLHLARGAPLLWVSRQLGHASVKITADTYGAWMQPESPGAADAFAERIAAHRVAPTTAAVPGAKVVPIAGRAAAADPR